MTETQILAEFTADTMLDDIPEAVITKAKEAIRDYIGVAIYGSRHPVGNWLTTYIDAFESGDEATVIGRGTASPPGAALANGAFGQAVDFDDTFETPVLHPSSPVFPAAFAATEYYGSSGDTLLTGYILGIEAAYRIGNATYPSHYEHGWHATGTIGTFGATVATASVLDLDTEAICHALGLAASSSSALKKNFGSATKPYHAGHAAEMGFRACVLAEDGLTADPAILEGPIGYGNVMTPDGEYDPSAIVDDLGEQWSMAKLGYKPYPSGALTHAAMEALRTIVIDEDLTPDDVDRIIVTLDDEATEMLRYQRPTNELQAKFSIEFCLAAILRERNVGIHQFTDEYVTHPETQAVLKKVERDFEPNLFGGPYLSFGASVIVETVDDRQLTNEVRDTPGGPANQLSDERWVEKYLECAETVYSTTDANAIASAINRLEEPRSLETLSTLLSSSPTRV